MGRNRTTTFCLKWAVIKLKENVSLHHKSERSFVTLDLYNVLVKRFRDIVVTVLLKY